MTVKIDGTNTVANPAFTGVDTDTGLQCGTNELKLVTGGSARATVDSSGRLGVGTESPGSWNGGANDLVISGSDNTGLTINATSSTSSSIHFADGSTGSESYRGIIEYNHTLDALQFYTSATKRARIDADGLKFNNDSGAVNALSDYEEGTFTPTYASGMNSPGYQVQEGSYTKIGSLVTCFIEIKANSGTNNSSHLGIGGLPFTASNTKDQGGGYFGYRDDLVNSGTNVFLHVPKNSSILYFYTQGGSIWAGNDGNGIYNRNIHVQVQYFT